MTSAKSATALQAFEILNAEIVGATVWQDVPDDEPLPVVIVGELLAVPFAGADDPDRRITLTVVTLTEGDESAPCSDLTDQVEQLLGGVSFPGEGWDLHFLPTSSSVEMAEDGSGYVGTTILTILAFSNG